MKYALLLVLVASAAQADVYRCTQADGSRLYSDTVCAGVRIDKLSENVTSMPPPPRTRQPAEQTANYMYSTPSPTEAPYTGYTYSTPYGVIHSKVPMSIDLQRGGIGIDGVWYGRGRTGRYGR